VFVLAGWAWWRTRRAHLILVGLIFFSWFGLGLVFTIGYCPCTDWHWMVREQLGYTDLPQSYLKYLVDALTGLNVNAMLVDAVAFVLFATVAALSAALNLRDFRARHP
jgi:signal transduction histidine kinase